MDGERFDHHVRMLTAAASRRRLTRLLTSGALAGLLGLAGPEAGTAARCKKPGQSCNRAKGDRCCGTARCKGGVCVCVRGTKRCRGRCIVRSKCCADADCGTGATCVDGTCACPEGQKRCGGTCIPENRCCGPCPKGSTCCTNVGQCKDVRNDRDFCGQCVSGRCPEGAICANGDCALTCAEVGAPCFAGCSCARRVDPAHTGEKVCAGLDVFSCETAKPCTTDASCAPGTAGFREVCVRDLCPGKSVCADPCA